MNTFILLLKLCNYFFYQSSFWEQWSLSFIYFLILYFGLGYLFNWVTRYLESKQLVFKMDLRPVSAKQIRYEISYSLVSIVLFGFSASPIVYGVRAGLIKLAEPGLTMFLVSLLLLNLWNEIHFFIVHRLMHVPFFMRHIHKIHHRSLTPTVYSVYSFHPVEALLLSTVPLCLVWFIPLEPRAIMVYPLTSILLNFSGHCNYRFWKAPGPGFFQLGTRHNEHHTRGRSNFGFASSLLDTLYKRFL